ncbi:MAG: hypothetical protein KAG53_11160 [Endozoicomonadaceae bacterium]|nr:hypothetical protein [Endozoicomonadaceae bacterium]
MPDPLVLSCKERFSLFLKRQSENGCCTAAFFMIFRFLGRKCHLVLDELECQRLLNQQQNNTGLSNQRHIFSRSCQIDLSDTEGHGNNNPNEMKSGNDTLNEIYFENNIKEEDRRTELCKFQDNLLFKYIDQFKKGNMEEFDISSYVSNKCGETPNITAWSNGLVALRDNLLLECEKSKKYEVLLEFYKTFFNVLGLVTADYEGRFHISKSFRDRAEFNNTMNMRCNDVTYEGDDFRPVDAQKLKGLLAEVEKIQTKYRGFPSWVFNGIPSDEYALLNYCGPSEFMPSRGEFYKNMDGRIKSVLFRKLAEIGYDDDSIDKLKPGLNENIINENLLNKIKEMLNNSVIR